MHQRPWCPSRSSATKALEAGKAKGASSACFLARRSGNAAHPVPRPQIATNFWPDAVPSPQIATNF